MKSAVELDAAQPNFRVQPQVSPCLNRPVNVQAPQSLHYNFFACIVRAWADVEEKES